MISGMAVIDMGGRLVKGKILNALIYVSLALLLSCFATVIVAQLYGFTILEVLFWVGLLVVSVGCLCSIGGDATEIRRFDGTVDGQYQSTPNFFKNFLRHGVFDPRVSGISIVVTGIILMLMSYYLR